MTDPVTIVECPRDAWQALRAHIPAYRKAAWLRSLIVAGFTHIDAVSFVSPAAVPQMADSEAVLHALEIPAHIDIIGIVVNRKGAERAIASPSITTLGFPYSISAEFLRRNQHQAPAESLTTLQEIIDLANNAARKVVAYVSMAFGNPYGEPWRISELLTACSHIAALGVHQISFADTVGLATPTQISAVFTAARNALDPIELGVHLHARPHDAPALIRAAYNSGCRRFDAAIGGLGGCPFAQDSLVGNIPTELLVQTLTGLGADLPALDFSPALLEANTLLAQQFSTTLHNS